MDTKGQIGGLDNLRKVDFRAHIICKELTNRPLQNTCFRLPLFQHVDHRPLGSDIKPFRKIKGRITVAKHCQNRFSFKRNMVQTLICPRVGDHVHVFHERFGKLRICVFLFRVPGRGHTEFQLQVTAFKKIPTPRSRINPLLDFNACNLGDPMGNFEIDATSWRAEGKQEREISLLGLPSQKHRAFEVLFLGDCQTCSRRKHRRD